MTATRREFLVTAGLAAASLCRTPMGVAAEKKDSTNEVRLLFVGDIMLEMLPGALIANGIDPFAPFDPEFRAADVVLGNLECVIATGGVQFIKPYTFRAHPRVIPFLEKRFHGLSLANNHTGDFGDEALLEELQLLKGRVPVFGGGRDLTEARKPLLLERNGLRIAILGYNEFIPEEFAAGENDPGVAWSVDEHVLADIRAAREVHQADIILPFMHWGWEFEPAPDDRQRNLARAMIDAGASAVIGGHPHVTQGAEIYKDRPIVYSLGNFVFDGFEEPEANMGWTVRLTVDKAGVVKWETVLHRHDYHGIPRPDWTAKVPSGRRGNPEVVEAIPLPPMAK